MTETSVETATEVQTVVPTAYTSASNDSKPFVCDLNGYTTEIVSLDPLVIYINDFLNVQEIRGILDAGYFALPMAQAIPTAKLVNLLAI
ncbi:hypothetical protein BDY21DRAFT_335691 [Lineolata rhizophorae]|uniref:Uncharacterized protein n=1 Tax=Lineolata rhizophorae TaxID=578093 RepID=A0A6A6P964_9PEZI|nr:hypothetical protein BDY21DRAFT_335691 [Lineolata rhizophorae]